MKAILDTNVVVSGIFFGGIPRRILELGQKRAFTNVISHEILDEYTEVVKRVAEQYSVTQAEKILDSVVAASDLTFSILLKEPVCADPKDDKFISAAIAAKVNILVSGDKHLKAVTGWAGITVLSPNAFWEMISRVKR